jgi:hypothetical protein
LRVKNTVKKIKNLGPTFAVQKYEGGPDIGVILCNLFLLLCGIFTSLFNIIIFKKGANNFAKIRPSTG